MKGKVYISGAGCGAYDLITLRGMNILKKADVIIYDSLIDKTLLDYAPENTEKIYVGKRSGHHSESQENINKLLVEKAKEGKTVVRLKGGDPFVFGRGGEEVIALKSDNIPYEIIPAVSSCIAVPELAGIPVTHRKISRSFHVITGHPLPENLEYYSNLDGTLIFLMGLENLRIISERLISGGMKKNMPCAVISGNQKATGKLYNIADNAEMENIKSPAVIVIGETAAFDFSSTIKKPLDGISVSVLGTRLFSEKLSLKLRENGADVRNHICMNISEYIKNPEFDNALENIDEYNMLVLTSMNGAEIFFRRMKKLEIDIRRISDLKIAVIGKGTADIFKNYGIYPDIIPEKSESLELAKIIVKENPEKVLILRSEKGSEVLTDILEKNKIIHDDIKIYNAEYIPPENNIDTDFLVFGSAFGAESFFKCGCKISPETKIVCIGSITAKAVPQSNKILISAEHDTDGIIKTILSEVQK